MEWKLYIEIGNEIFVMQYLRVSNTDIQSGLDTFCDCKLCDSDGMYMKERTERNCDFIEKKRVLSCW